MLDGYHFTLNREHVCKQGFLAKCLCLSNAWCTLFLTSWKENLNDVFGLLNSLGSKQGLGENPTLFEAWCLGICGWFRHQWLTKYSMSHWSSQSCFLVHLRIVEWITRVEVVLTPLSNVPKKEVDEVRQRLGSWKYSIILEAFRISPWM